MNDWQIPENYQAQIDALIKSLRQEASEAKGCFTTFSFQSIALSSAALGIIFNSIKNNSISALAVIPLVGLLMVVSRIGIYKYTAANRAYGLQAYIERTEPLYRMKRLSKYDKEAFENLFTNSDWERLFMVWRVVMPSVISPIYKFPIDGKPWDLVNPFMYNHTPEYLESLQQRQSLRRTIPGQPIKVYEWFKIKSLTGNKYRPGTYLKNMLLVLTIMQFLYLFSLCIAILYDVQSSAGRELGMALNNGFGSWLLQFLKSFLGNPSAMTMFVALIIIGLMTYSRTARTNKRRVLLECGILSIHSCAVVWRLALIAHSSALKITLDRFSIESNTESIDAYAFDRKYMHFLHKEIDALKQHAGEPSKWLQELRDRDEA